MDLKTTWLGFELANPLVAGASPLCDDIDNVKRMEDAGISAVVLRSLFEEQIVADQMGMVSSLDSHEGSGAEASSYLPRPDWFWFGPEKYLELIAALKASVSVPVVASLNGNTPGGWLDYAKLLEQAGADAIELNLYDVVTDPGLTSSEIESTAVAVVSEVRSHVKVPINVKLSPFYSALPNVARRLVDAGANGLTLFNRFYQPDFDIEELEVSRKLELSTSSELLMRLNWLAILSAQVESSYSVSGGVHTYEDALKATMAGADAIQMVSALLLRGATHITKVRDELTSWLEEHDYASLGQARGSMNLTRTAEPHAFERANYMRILQTWGG